MTDKLRFLPTFNENVKLSFPSVDEEDNIENDQSPIWNSWPVVVKVNFRNYFSQIIFESR